MGGLFRGSFGEGVRGLIFIALSKTTHTFVVSENIPFSTKPLLILLISAFLLQKSQRFLTKIISLLKALVEGCLRDFSVLFLVFVR